MRHTEYIKPGFQQNKCGESRVHSCLHKKKKRQRWWNSPVHSRGPTTDVFWSVHKQRHSKQLHHMCENFSQPISCWFLHSFSYVLGIWQIRTNGCHKIIPTLASQTNERTNNQDMHSVQTSAFIASYVLAEQKWNETFTLCVVRALSPMKPFVIISILAIISHQFLTCWTIHYTQESDSVGWNEQ